MAPFCDGQRRDGLVLCRGFAAAAVHRKKRDALGQQAGHLPEGAASHQQAVRLDHARQSVLHVFTHVEYDGLPEYLKYSGPCRAAREAGSFLGAVERYLSRQTPRDLWGDRQQRKNNAAVVCC